MELIKNYRVWEVNRKVLLYPKNRIEPELRDDKSPFFMDLEGELLQDEVPLPTAETAFLSYLEKLDAVGRLRMVATGAEQSLVATLVEHCDLRWTCPRITWDQAGAESSGEHRTAGRNRTPESKPVPDKPKGTRRDSLIIHELLDLISEDDPGNVYAGEIEVRPPGAPTTLATGPCARDRWDLLRRLGGLSMSALAASAKRVAWRSSDSGEAVASPSLLVQDVRSSFR